MANQDFSELSALIPDAPKAAPPSAGGKSQQPASKPTPARSEFADIAALIPDATTKAGDGGSVDTFVQQYRPLAERVAKQVGVAPEALLGQWGLETGWGRSVIPGTNNLGNVKNPFGNGVRATDNMTGSRDAYQTFDSIESFGDGFTGLLSRRYKSALNAGGDAQRYFSALKAGGYAEDPDYISKGLTATRAAAAAMGKGQAVQTGDYGSTYREPTKPRGVFGAINDSVIDAANAATGLVKAGSDLVSPGNPVSKFIDEEIIKAGQEKQSDYKKGLRQELSDELKAVGQSDGTTGGDVAAEFRKAGVQLTHALTKDPLGTASEMFGNMGPFAILGRGMQAARLAEATRTAISAAAAGGLSAGEVRGNIWEKISGMKDADLQAASPAYAELRRRGMAEQDAKREVGANLSRNLPEVAIVGAIGALSGKFGPEAMAAGVAPKYTGGRVASGVLGFLDEGPVQGGSEQLASNYGVQRAIPSQRLLEDVGQNIIAEGIPGAGMGVAFGGGNSRTKPTIDPSLKPVLDKAKENNSPLSKAAAEGIKAQPITESQPASQDAAQRLAELEQKLQSSSLSGEEVQEYKTLRQLKDDNDAIRNELSGAGAEKQDDILYRASQIEQAVNTNSGISALRQPDSPVDAKQFLNDLAIAKSKSSNPAAREQALSRLEFAAGWMGIDLTGPAPVAGPGKVWSQEGVAAQNAIGKAAEIAGPQDSISKRVSEIEDEIRSTNAISALRSIGQSGVTEKEFLEALAIAKNPSIDKKYPGLRQRALESLETGMEWVRQGSMPGVGSKVNFTFGNNNPTGTSLTVPGSREVGPAGAGQFFDPNVIDGEAARVDENRLPGPRAITGPQSGAIQDIAPESRSASSPAGSAPALGFTGAASPAEQQNVAQATADQGEAPSQQAPALSVSEATSNMPRVAIPQDGGSGATAARRKRKAQLGQLVQAGFGTVEKRGEGFVLHNVKTGQSVQLDGAADVQMARQAVTQAQRSQADTSPNSPANDKTPASEAQIAAGNYSKPSSVVNGITVRYENPKGSTRSGVDSDGVVWSTTMKHDYGHDDRVVGADGDKLDIFVGDNPSSSKIFVIDQQNPDGSFDEHKVILGARSEDEARKTYLANYESGWTGLGDITELTREQYDAWTAGGQVSEPISLGKNDVVTLSDAGQPVKVQLISADEIGSGKKPGNGYYALTKQDAGIISAIGAALGVRTAFFRGITPGFSPDGIYTQGNTVLMGENYSRGPLSVFLHEFTHLLEGSNPKAYGSLMAVIRSRVADPKGYRADYYGKQYAEQKGDTALSDDELRELIGDLGGDMMNDAAFWGDVFADIQAKHGREAQGIIAKLAEFLDSLIQKAIASIPQKAFGASKFVNEASEIREAFRTAVTSYMEENGFQYNGAASEIAKAAQMMAEQQTTTTPAPDSQPSPSVAEDVLQDVGLLREHAGRWKYRTRPEGTWFTANSKADAVDRATAGYLSMPESDRLTRAQRDAKADAEYDAESERRYGRLSIEQLEKLLSTTAGDIAANQKAGQGEFNGNGGRRTGAAVSSEAARVLGEEKMRLERYIASRKAADAQKPTQESSAPAAPDDGIKIRAGKGLIKGKFNAEADGDVVPGGPFDTEQAARAAALQWRAKSKQRADDAAAEKVRRDAIAQKFRDGKPVTAIEIKSLGLPGGTSDVRDFFGIAADLFGLKSRDIRPIVKDFIRESTTDMGAKREYVATRKALEAIGKSQSEQGQANSADLDATTLTPKQYHEAKLAQISSEYGTPMSEVREMYDTEGGRAEHQREWLGKVEQAAKNGAKLTRQTLDKFFEIAPTARLPEGSMPDGYQKPEARKSEAEERQARAQGRRDAKAGAASNDGGSEKQKPPILQNRNRSTPSSIAQMQSIASRPDYGRLGFSRDFANGAPVVAGGSIPTAQLGTKDVAVASDGRRIPIQYAVVDASSILASNRADGTPNADYADQSIDRVRAIAGNGRVAGMQAAYSSGTTSQYEDELANDMLHGVSREAIRSLRQPVLVRVMPSDQVTDDIGDVSNTVGNLSLSPVEQANNDAQRVNLDALQFSDDGGITSETVRQFVRSMPQAEQGGLIDTNGQPTRQAVDRLNAAVFAKAYGNDQLVRLYAQASDQEARNILSALSQVAPKMARLDGAGSLDVREIVTQAAEIAINARRRGDTLDRAAAQIDMAADPDVGVVLQLFADNTRTVRPVVEALGRMADMAYSEANKPSEDMFGAVEKAGRQDIINQLKPENERASKTNLEVAAGGKPAQVNADRGEAQAGAQGNAAATEGGRASQAQGLTPTEIPARVRGQLDALLRPIKDVFDELQIARRTDQRFKGDGRYAAELMQKEQGKVDAALKKIAQKIGSIPNAENRALARAYVAENSPDLTLSAPERRYLDDLMSSASATPASQVQQGEPLLTAPTPEEIVTRQDAAEAAQRAAEAAERKSNEDERKRQERDEVRVRSNAAADTFELGMDPMENLTGQQDIFSMPAPAPQKAAAAQSKNTVFTEDAASQARERLKRKLSGQAKFSMARDQGNSAPQQGIDAEMMMDGITLSGYHIESGARTFADYAGAMLADLGEGVRPYLKSWYMGVKYDPRASGFTGMDSASTVDAADVNALTAQESKNAPSTDEGVERDSQDATPGRALVNPVSSGPRGATEADGATGGRATGKEGGGQPRDSGLPAGGTALDGNRGDFLVPGGNATTDAASVAAGADFRERGGDIGVDGVSTDPVPAAQVEEAADRGIDRLKKEQIQKAAEKIKVIPQDIENIRATLPYLLEGQQDDVLKTEMQFAKPDGYGMLFTNGTGTGKTFTGLGVVKRMQRQGKTSILIVVPDDKIAADWIESGDPLGLSITKLKDTKDAGSGIVITTYANLGDNDALATRQWDLVVADEAHTLMQSEDGKVTTYLANLRAITDHPDGAYRRAEMLHGQIRSAAVAAQSKADLAAKSDDMRDWPNAAKYQAEADRLFAEFKAKQKEVSADVASRQGEARARLLALSATPFAYEFTVDWANGYLFDYNEGQSSDQREFRGYNQGSNRDRFFMSHFGYSMRYNKLTKPDPSKVDTGLMQRNFNGWLRKKGALSARMLDVPADYDRRFVLVESGIGNQIDDALNWISEKSREGKGYNGYSMLRQVLDDKFDFLSRRYLLEAIKATEVVPIVRQHMKLGRKVVVFHDYKKGGGFNPFDIPVPGKPAEDATPEQIQVFEDYKAAVMEFRAKFNGLVNAPLSQLDSPIEVFQREIPGVMLVNGDEKKKDLLNRYKAFQDDDTGPQVMLVQSAKNKGWSGHDATGKHQRVLINLGQPTAPTLAIQQEGRIYRTGQVTDAIMRYLNTGTTWEKMTFASTIAGRASTAENLGMGEQARALKDSFIASFEESDAYPPGHEGEGKGGKERDKLANSAITAYDRAKTYYWATQKKNSKTKAQEGADYYATPEPVGFKMAEWLGLRGGESSLEPSAGHGAIARWLPEITNRTVIEPSNVLRARLAMVMDAGKDRIIDDTFENHAIVNKYDGIAMNPPFGVGGKTAIEHVAKAANHLRDGGRIVALIPTGPAADKRFDQWMYGESERQAKPLYIDPNHGPVYKGDTLTLTGFGTLRKIVVDKVDGRVDGPRYVRDANTPPNGAINITAISKVEPTGKRTESYRASEGLYTVADIKLPQVTFERAGTAVATRIVVLEKQTDSKRAPSSRSTIDLSGITDIKELFDRIEDLTLPARAMTPEQQAADKAAQEEGQRQAKKIEAKSKPKAANPDAVGTVDRNGEPIIEHVTAKGKTLRGIVRTDLLKEEALAIDPYTLRKNGGWFIREVYLKPEGDAKLSRARSDQNDATLAEYNRRIESMKELISCIGK